MRSKHIVTYIGNGTWRDSNDKPWEKNTTEEVESTMTQEQYLETRPDIEFMVEYGAMKINTITIEDAPVAKPEIPVAKPVVPATPPVVPATPPVTPTQTK